MNHYKRITRVRVIPKYQNYVCSTKYIKIMDKIRVKSYKLITKLTITSDISRTETSVKQNDIPEAREVIIITISLYKVIG